MLIPALGPVTDVTAGAGDDDLVHLVLRHDSGAASTVSLTLHAEPGSEDFTFSFWGPAGVSGMPDSRVTPVDALRLAARELAENVSAGRRSHPCDVSFGSTVVSVLAAAERALGTNGVAT